jgi:ABC-type sugar transport system permease subunit
MKFGKKKNGTIDASLLKSGVLSKSEGLSAYKIITPFMILLFIFVFWIFIHGFYLALTDAQGINVGEFVGFENFKALLWKDPIAVVDFWRSARITFTYMLGGLITQIPIAFLLAYILNHIPLQRLRVILRASFFFPVLINTVVIALLFRMLFNRDQGIINWVLGMLGFANDTNWLMNSSYAIPVLVIVSFWQWTGFHMVYFLSQLQVISPSIYEAAKIDGASPLRILWRITLPMMRPAITFVVVTSTIGGLQMFDLVFMVFPNAQFGPGGVAKTLVAYIFDEGFSQSFRTGFASAIGWLTFLLIMIVSLIQLKFIGLGKHEE